MKLFSAHQLLLMHRERKAVMGHRAIGIWLLSAVLIATFLSIAFSAGSLSYLDEKMNDPFTYWLNVKRANPHKNLANIARELLSDSLPDHFHYDDTQITQATSQDMLCKNGASDGFHIQYYEDLTSDLIRYILKEESVVDGENRTVSVGSEDIGPNSLGVIMTEDAMARLGYSNGKYPGFVNIPIKAPGADSLGFVIYPDDYVAAPVPLLAVVKRLPMHKDMISSRFMDLQYSNRNTFNMCKEKYAYNLLFFVPNESIAVFDEVIGKIIPDSILDNPSHIDACNRLQTSLRTWQQGSIKQICYLGRPPLHIINTIERDIVSELSGSGVVRVYDYDIDSTPESEASEKSYEGLSIHFSQLDSIRAFERYVTQRWKDDLQIEMTQVSIKENFNSVSTMANILTVALIVFSIITIVIFIVNMMQYYFQKVKRNLGTFKAFGISTKELIMVYMTIVLGIIVLALLIALSVTWGAELLLNLSGCTKEGGAPHLILWNYRTLFAIVIILSSTIISTLIVMRRLLRQTPGDLIYDRGA